MLKRWRKRIFPGRSGQETADRQKRFELERVGRSRMDDVVSSTRQVPWVLTLLQLLWTAGPVTWLAIQGGSLLGYGEVVETPTYLFFAFYIVIAAVIGVFARSAAQGIRKSRADKARRNMTRTVDLLPELIFTVRDLQLSILTPTERTQHAAGILLRKTDLGPESVALAIEELSGNQQLASVARSIDIYRRLGMYSRMDDLISQSDEYREAIVHHLYEQSPELSETVSQRLQGEAPSQDEGIARHDNFIDHILSAAQHNNLSLMSLEDVEDLITLTFELMCGREITQLTLGFVGDFQTARALDELEFQRNEYRLINATVMHHLRNLADQLADSELTALTMEDQAHDPRELQKQVLQALSELSDSLSRSRTRKMHQRAARQLKSALIGARRTQSAITRLHDRYRKYRRAAERWNAIRAERTDSARASGQGIRIRESAIALTDEQKIYVAEAFCRYMREMHLDYRRKGVLRKDKPMTVADAKHLAIRLTLLLERTIGIGDASAQRAIESSNAAYFEGLESHFSADAKLGLGSAVVKEVQQRLDKVAEVLVLRLTKLYHLPVSDNNIRFLVKHYGADQARLSFIVEQTDNLEDNSAMIPPEPVLMRDNPAWRSALGQAERALAWVNR